MLDKIVYAAIGVGLAMCGAGVAYVVSFEGRISKLETQVGFLSGAANATVQGTTKAKKSNVSSELNLKKPIKISVSEVSQSTIANGCTKYMNSYNNIITSEEELYTRHMERLEALNKQMKFLGCDKILQ